MCIVDRRKTIRYRFYLSIIILTVLLSLPRFAHYTPDSIHYVELAKYFRGDLSRADLFAPQAYRVLVPWVAAIIPIQNLDFNFAAINLVATIFAYFIFARYLGEFVHSRTQLNLGMLLLVVSFPSFNYSSAVLTDAVGFLILVAASLLLLRNKPYQFCLLATVGVLIRDALLTLVLIFVLYSLIDTGSPWKRKFNLPLLLVIVAPTALYLIIRLHFADIGGYYRPFALDNAISIFTEPNYWLTSTLTIFPPLLIFLTGIRSSGWAFLQQMDRAKVRLLAALTIVNCGILLVGISGRYIWPLYTSLIPAAVLSSESTALSKWLSAIANRIFGAEEIVPT